MRNATRATSGSLLQEPPRTTRWPQLPDSQALPSVEPRLVSAFPAVLHPLPNIADHVVEPEGIGLEAADRGARLLRRSTG